VVQAAGAYGTKAVLLGEVIYFDDGGQSLLFGVWCLVFIV
jgi:hypothetical protein